MPAEKCKLYTCTWHEDEKIEALFWLDSHFFLEHSREASQANFSTWNLVQWILYRAPLRDMGTPQSLQQPKNTHRNTHGFHAAGFPPLKGSSNFVFRFPLVQWKLFGGYFFSVNRPTERTQGPNHKNTSLINLKQKKGTIYHGKYFLRRWANICFKTIRQSSEEAFFFWAYLACLFLDTDCYRKSK